MTARRSDQGAALVLALAFITVFGLLMAFILAQVDVNFRTTGVVRSRDSRQLAADGGIDFGIQRARDDGATVCQDPANDATFPFPGGSVNGQSVSITCHAMQGAFSEGAAENWAIVTTSTAANSLETQSGGGGDPMIIRGGDVFVSGGFSLGRSLTVEEGDVYANASPCPSAATRPTVAPPDQFICTTDPTPDVLHTLPSSIPPPALPPQFILTPAGRRSCTVFFPGKYTLATRPVILAKDGPQDTGTYFVSGVYYFENTGPIVVENGAVVVGGASGAQTPLISGTPCATDAVALPGVASGAGVKFIFGGTSSLEVKNGKVELFDRVGTEGAPGINIQAVRPDEVAAGWVPSIAIGGNKVYDSGGGSNANAVVHGLVYAPTRDVSMFVTSDVVGRLRGGAIASRLILQASASGDVNGLVALSGRGRRTVQITSTATGPAGEVQITDRAVVRISNNRNRSTAIRSWRTL